MGLFWSNSWSLALIFCTHANKNLTFNLSKFGGRIQHILFFMIFGIENRKNHKKFKTARNAEPLVGNLL